MVTNFAKRQRRSLVTSYRRYRNRFTSVEALSGRPRLADFWEHFDLIAVDHGLVRLIYLNLHEVVPGVWRSAQPSPRHIRQLAQRGVRTVVNLRGHRDCGSYRLERQACAECGIDMIDFRMRSRGVPRRETIHEARALFDRIEYPVLMHCKSGADRVGMMSALYLLLHEGRPVEDAVRQLSLRYGHFKRADTGVLDHFFDWYLADNADAPMPFMQWVDERYEPEKVAASFKARGFANFFVDRVLRRE